MLEEYGLAIKMGGCSFRPNNGRFRLNISVLDSNGDAVTEEAEGFTRYAVDYGLSPNDLGSKFMYRGQSYVVCGLRRKNHEYPILARSSDGKEYNCSVQIVYDAMERDIPF